MHPAGADPSSRVLALPVNLRYKPDMHVLMMLTGPREGQRVELTAEVVLGRSPSVSLPIEDGRLSRRHARVWLEGGRAHVEDLGSSNGTCVNGATLSGPVVLLPGDRVQAGETSFLYVATAPAAVSDVAASGALRSRRLEEVLPREGLAGAVFEAALALQGATSESMVLGRAADELLRSLKVGVGAALLGGASGWVTAVVRGEGQVEVPRALLKAALDDREVASAGAEACGPLVASGGLPFGILYVAKGSGEFTCEELGLLGAMGRLAGDAYVAQRSRTAAPLLEVELIGASEPFRACVEQARHAAGEAGPVLFEGETGSGRAHLARWVHSRSARSHGPFVTVDCRGSAEVVEETLFGRASEPGLPPLISAFLLADGGTLLLAGVEALSAQAAQRVARLIERGTAPAPGGGEEPVDVRVMATALSGDAGGGLEGSLARALCGLAVVVPPLRSRSEDLPALFERFALPLARARGAAVPRLSPEALRLLSAYRWPHNVSELRLTAERLALLHSGAEIPALLLPPEVQEGVSGEEVPRTLAERVQQLERSAIAEALREAGGKKIRAAELLGISRPTLDKKIDDYELVVHKVRGAR